jgi:hypothetical protein
MAILVGSKPILRQGEIASGTMKTKCNGDRPLMADFGG